MSVDALAETIRPLPGETIVVRSDLPTDELIEPLRELFPDNAIIVLTPGTEIGTLDVDELAKRVARLEDVVLGQGE